MDGLIKLSTPSAGARRDAWRRIPSAYISSTICLLVSGYYLAAYPNCFHWSIVPITLCGMLIGIHAVEWIRGNIDIFDPVGLIGLYGVHFFFVSPLLHIGLDEWVNNWVNVDVGPDDRRPWVGYMAIINVVGLVGYLWMVDRGSRGKGRNGRLPNRTLWTFRNDRFLVLLAVLMAASVLAQASIYLRFGGVQNYLITVEDEGNSALEGLGRLAVMGESFPMLFLIGSVTFLRNSPLRKSWFTGYALLAVFLVFAMLFGGMRGNRGMVVWNMFFGIIMVHLLLRPFSRKLVVGGLIGLVLFMYLYGFYKWGGRDALANIFDADERKAWVEQSGKSMSRTLLHDLSRTNIQADILYHMNTSEGYPPALGRTYYAALALFVPKTIWPDRPVSKWKEVTDVHYGEGAYVPGKFALQWVVGIAGETMLNFTWVMIPFSYAILGFIIGRIRRFKNSLDRSDARMVIVPLLIGLCFYLFAWDSNNLVTYTMRFCFLPIVFVCLTTRKRKLPAPGDAPAAG